MIVVRATDVPLLQAPAPARRRARLLLDPAVTGDGAASMGMSVYAPGEAAPQHAHASCEIMYVLAGTGTFAWEGGSVQAGPGTALFAPAGEPHSIRNEGDTVLEFLWIYAPAGGEVAIKENWRPAGQ
jgi:quercetin dioxygenase-like cupin family protein